MAALSKGSENPAETGGYLALIGNNVSAASWGANPNQR
jgi:hypothetical protein